MATNDFSKITTLAQLREARKEISDEIRSYGQRRKCLLPAIRFLRNIISGTPFAKS